MTESTVPLSLYVHWPWCARKCPYCDFNSHALLSRSPEESEGAYLDALITELKRVAPLAQGRRFETVFIGGGTPSLMTGETVEKLLAGIESTVGLAEGAEITLEANPGTVEADRFKAYRAAGVNRLSIGVQSFQNDKLKLLGRIHTAEEALRAIEIANATFDNFNLDVMFGLPTESLPDLEHELTMATKLAPTHLSFYQLTIEEGTAFAKRLPQGLPDEDMLADMTDLVEGTLAARGYEHYEVSGYAQLGRRCRHNLNYWTYGDYLAIGAGAHAKVTDFKKGEILRYRDVANPLRYIERVKETGRGLEEAFTVAPEEIPFEFMLNILRLVEGVPAELFRSRVSAVKAGLDWAKVDETLAKLRAEGLLIADTTRIATTEKGLRFLSDVQEAFL